MPWAALGHQPPDIEWCMSKLAIIRDTYTALHGEAAGGRAELLEIAILLLIAVEIVLSLVRY